MEDQTHMLAKSFSIFQENTQSPENYLHEQENKVEEFKTLTKSLYDNTWKDLRSLISIKPKSLPKLITKGFDEEQVWQQLELQNDYVLPSFLEKVSNLNSSDVTFDIDITDSYLDTTDKTDSSAKNKLTSKSFNEYEESCIKNEGYVFDDDSDSSIGEPARFSESDDEDEPTENKSETLMGKETLSKEDYDFDDDSDSLMDESSKNVDKSHEDKSIANKKTYSTVVDDQFFKVSKLEEFLKLEDLKEERGEQDNSDEEIDMFADIPSEIDDDSENEEEDYDEKEEKGDQRSSKDIMYGDFFDPPESGDESATEKEFVETEEKEIENHNDYDHEENTVEDEIAENEHSELKKHSSEKSAFEIEQEKVKKQIQDCEKLLLKPVPWQFTGEVEASKRPTNSLIHQNVDFDSNARKELVVDDTLTEKTENIIRMAIINQAWHDVERKVKTTEEMIAQTRKVVIEQTKSKKGLAEVYEDDYLKKKEKQKEEEDPKHQAIQKLMDSLFPELHALFSHIPKPPIPEIKVVSNLPAVTVEDVAPTTMSDAHLLAPHEVKRKTGLVKGKTERTDTDRKRERRKKKMFQKMVHLENEAKEKSGAKSFTAKGKKKERLETLKKLKRNKNTTIAEDHGQKIKSSKDFFSRLQDAVSSKASGKTQEKKSKNFKKNNKQ